MTRRHLEPIPDREDAEAFDAADDVEPDLGGDEFLLPGPGPRPAFLDEGLPHPRISERRARAVLDRIEEARRAEEAPPSP